MTPERWKQVWDVYSSAVARPAHERASALAALCGGDELLRGEVESLLAHADEASNFLEAPAWARNGLTDRPSLAGRQFGSYRVGALLRAGGMGEVYHAHDEQLGREVAIKILPPIFASDPERLARFANEARALAALNHVHIGTIYGLEQIDGGPALVLELVEGATLAERIAVGPLPVEFALDIARQIADALEAAHDRGIIHRDLKPANIKITPEGVVKVLDFGLAKLRVDLARPATALVPESPPNAGVTREGVIVGTAAYMSPEQARGNPVDQRTDVWAFGCVVFEMLTGRQVFAGETVTDTLAAILDREPDWAALPPPTPVAVRRLLRRCLEKNHRRRLSAIGDARLELDDVSEVDRDGVFAPAPAAVAPAWRRVMPWTAAVVVGGALLSALLVWSPWRSTPVATQRKLLARIGADATLPTDGGASAVVSPDGETLAFVGQQAGGTTLFVRRLDELDATALTGSQGAADPFFSPDNQWIGFFAGGRLKKVPATGGSVVDLTAAPAGRGGTWTEDGTIIFSPANVHAPLMRVSASGGTAAIFGRGGNTQRWPQALPGDRGVLYTEHASLEHFDGANLVIAPLSGGTPRVIVRGAYFGRYVPSGRARSAGIPSGGGHLLYMRQGQLLAARFDLDRLETIGPAVPALEGIAANPTDNGGAQVSVSSDGTLVYVPGAATTTQKTMEWMARDGTTSTLRGTKASWSNPRLSPDGRRVAFELFDGRQYDIWVYDWGTEALTQLTFDAAADRKPFWTPDGRRVTFSSDRAQVGVSNVYWVNADGTGEVAALTDRSTTVEGWSWHPSGRFLAMMGRRPGLAGGDLLILPMNGDAVRGWTPGPPSVFLDTPAHEVYPVFSPDGRWIAYYAETAAGTRDLNVFVRPFSGPGGPWRISTESGWYPQWSATTQELLFLTFRGHASGRQVMVAPYTVEGNSFRPGRPRAWSPTNIPFTEILDAAYDIHPDGTRIAIAGATPDPPVGRRDEVVFLFNFFEYLGTIAPGRR
jgi:Tol biopolymer transport system component